MYRTLEDAFSKENNFDLLRLIAALLVLYGHSFIMVKYNAYPAPFSDLMNALSPWKDDWEDLAVNIFFVISGFLITASYLQSQNFFSFLKKRIIRIYPAAVVSITLCVVLLYFTSAVPFQDYFFSDMTREFWIDNSTMRKTRYHLPGVFEEVRVSRVINGSLWTLPLEVKCYLYVAILGLVGALRHRWVMNILVGVVAVSIAVPGWSNWIVGAPDKMRVYSFFIAGAAIYANRDFIPLGRLGLALFAVLFTTLVFWPAEMPGAHLLYVITISYAVLGLALFKPLRAINLRPIGDWSYGVYLYAFPVQQTLVWAYPSLTGWGLVMAATPLVLLCGALSWHGVEKHALRLKTVKLLPSVQLPFKWPLKK
ncbi:acyltransferase [Magnetovibrio sp. PR-2]|uniref:acyltransferase family protein n=1 Tax=Magnetovibrio sp. PR-2 TaxID=3120356 RepID=UPI002FCDF2D0